MTATTPAVPRALKVRDSLRDAQLLRDVSIINAQTVKRLGPLPPGGLPVRPKRKPSLPQHTSLKTFFRRLKGVIEKMKRILRYFFIAVGVVATLAVIGVTGLYFLGEHILSARRLACEKSEDFVAVRSKLEAALKDGTIDQPVMDREKERIATAQEACLSGDQDKSRALLMGVMMDAAFQSDDVYARKVNGRQDKGGQQADSEMLGNPSSDLKKP